MAIKNTMSTGKAAKLPGVSSHQRRMWTRFVEAKSPATADVEFVQKMNSGLNFKRHWI
jgi:hypothetical protein